MIYNGSTIYNEGADGEGSMKVFAYSYREGAWQYPSVSEINASVLAGKVVYLREDDPGAGKTFYALTYRGYGSGNITLRFVEPQQGKEIVGYLPNGGSESWTRKSMGCLNEIVCAEYDPTSTYTEKSLAMHEGLMYYCSLSGGIVTPEAWDYTHWTRTSVAEQIGSIKNGGALTDAASVDVPNNALSTLATAQAALTLNVNVGANEVPNFAVEVTPSVDVTLTVTKTVGNTTTTLNSSVAGGNSLTTGKLYQVTCVGNCWTLAEFTVPTP